MPTSISRWRYVDRLVEDRPQHRGEVDAEVRAAVDRLAAHQTHVVGVLGEELGTRREHQLDLRPAPLGDADGVAEPLEPVRQQPLEDLPVEGVLRVEVVQQARPPDPDASGDVVQRRAVVAVLGEAVERLGEDLLARRSE